jgi:hypothetical protein
LHLPYSPTSPLQVFHPQLHRGISPRGVELLLNERGSLSRFCAVKLCHRPKSGQPSRGCFLIAARKTDSASLDRPLRRRVAANDCRTG